MIFNPSTQAQAALVQRVSSTLLHRTPQTHYGRYSSNKHHLLHSSSRKMDLRMMMMVMCTGCTTGKRYDDDDHLLIVEIYRATYHSLALHFSFHF